MWGIDPKKLCNQHLLGEHVEMHMFVGCIKKGISLKGYYDNKLVCTDLIKKRHDDLMAEMISRSMKHNSPIVEIDLLGDFKYGEIDIEANINELISRCSKCRDRLLSGATKI
ncbi:MAG: pyrimidine dimer DNA glycosylase/endonuclease V [Actinobacteria bacterium]|nr:pyrimidine dimer DNA glycosylase/endonuclease V [Actinomycetota bacterium]